jgi:N-acetylglutamate synthase-like GNAT family acetyltransferase
MIDDMVFVLRLSVFGILLATGLLLLPLQPVEAALVAGVTYRNGRKSDELAVALTMAGQLMNPLGVRARNFVVAEEGAGRRRRVGWAQIRPLGPSRVDPAAKCGGARPGSYDAERAADDAAWEELEADDAAVAPHGWSSLPWTREYRAFADAAKKRRERRDAIAEREKRKDRENMLYELASVYVIPEYRGRGIGTELVERVLQRHAQQGHALSSVYLLTLATTAGWYEDNFGFQVVEEEEQVPAQLSFEVTAGKIITKFIGAELCCMRGPDERPS